MDFGPPPRASQNSPRPTINTPPTLVRLGLCLVKSSRQLQFCVFHFVSNDHAKTTYETHFHVYFINIPNIQIDIIFLLVLRLLAGIRLWWSS